MRIQSDSTALFSSALLTTLLLWTMTGCKPKQEPTFPSKATLSTNTQLQAELNSAAGPPIEHNPAKRPLIVSRPAPDGRLWLVQALEQGYRDTGRTNTAWDAKARTAFEAYADYRAGTRTNWPALQKAMTNVVATGCDDPMVAYMRVRYGEEVLSKEKTASEFIRAHKAISASRYHPVFKFYAGMRAVESARAADLKSPRKYQMERTTVDLEDLARDTNAPAAEVFEAANLWLHHSNTREWTKYVTSDLEAILKQNWGASELWFSFEGSTEVQRAWGERGGGWATTVTKKGWEGFGDHLEKADQFLTKAWQMNSSNAYTAYLMMQVELGQGQGRERMELWFNRAMSLATNYYDAVKLMSFYLEPRWHGSEDDSLEFARSCVASDKWGGEVPLILPNVHHSLATYFQMSNSPAYWHRPEIWRDIKSSYEKFFALNPEAAGYRHNYAMDAYDCGQYSVFLEQTKLFAYGTNHQFFGGPEKFRQMLQTATAASPKPPESPATPKN